jgi:putative transposase
MPSTPLRRFSSFSHIGPHRYSLTFGTFNRQRLFVDARVVEIVRSQILRAGELCGFEVFAYCFMPDHLHLLVGGSAGPARLTVFAQRAKQLSGYYGRRHLGGPIWQVGYFERILREAEDTRSVVAHILGNPVRAGLVVNPGDHPFSGSGVCSLAELLEYVSDRP